MTRECVHGNPKCEKCQAELAAMCALAAGVLIGLMIGFFIWRVAFP